MRYGIRAHDFEGFAFEFKRWGAYLPGMVAPAQSAASAVQIGMVWQAGEESEDDGEDEGDYDPSVDLPAGVETEAGPVVGGAPDADWADGYERPDLPEFLTDDEDAAVREAGRRIDDHNALVRANFPKEFAESDICAACGLFVFDHDPEVCQGGTPETRKRRSRKMPSDLGQIQGEAQAPDPEGLGVSGESIVLGLYSPSGDEPPPGVGTLDDYLAAVAAESEAGIGYVSSNGTNGNHDRDDVAGLLCDPDAVMRVLSGHGWKIAFRGSVGEAMGFYINPETDAPYDTGDVESEYRAAVSGRGGA